VVRGRPAKDKTAQSNPKSKVDAQSGASQHTNKDTGKRRFSQGLK